jgi:hypothetical protein
MLSPLRGYCPLLLQDIQWQSRSFIIGGGDAGLKVG